MARAPDERTPEERAAAAAERAARRGEPPPPPSTFAASVRPADVQPEPVDGDPERFDVDPERFDADSEPFAADGDEHTPPPPAPEPPAPEPTAVPDPPARFAREPEPEPAPQPDPEPITAEPFHESQRFGDDSQRLRDDSADYEPFEPEPAERPRRVSRMAARAPQRPRRAPARRPPRPPRRGTPSRAHGRRRLALLLALIGLAGVLWLLNSTFQPFHGEGSGSVKVSIPEGANAGRIGELLEEKGVVESGTFFQANATITGRRGRLRPGDYTLQQGMSYGGAIDALVQGPKAKVVKTVDVTVPEGLSIREAAPRVDEGPLEGSYLKAARSDRTLQRIRDLGAPRRTRTAEGFLFPATYTLVDGAPARNLVDRQLVAFKENFGKVDLGFAQRKNLTRYDVLIIASMIERETQLDKERPLVASVIYNRLSQGIPLGIDATIRYYENNWSKPLLQSELERDSPYNTRLNRDLPPTPIGNPGLASLQAAAKPARSDYLFYVAKPGTCGHAFSSTDAEFAADVARYNAARDAKGGKSPTTC